MNLSCTSSPGPLEPKAYSTGSGCSLSADDEWVTYRTDCPITQQSYLVMTFGLSVSLKRKVSFIITAFFFDHPFERKKKRKRKMEQNNNKTTASYTSTPTRMYTFTYLVLLERKRNTVVMTHQRKTKHTRTRTRTTAMQTMTTSSQKKKKLTLHYSEPPLNNQTRTYQHNTLYLGHRNLA